MIFFKDLTQAEPVYRDFPLKENTTFTNGCLLRLITTAGSTYADVQASTWINTLGLYAGPTKTTSSGSTIALGTSEYGRVIVNPFAVYLAEYDLSTKVTATNFSTKTITATSEAQAGDWFLNQTTTSAAYGELLYIASTSTTASVTALSTPTVTPGTTDEWVHIHCIGKGQGAAQYARMDLNTTATKMKSGSSYGGVGIQLIDNHIKSRKSTSLQPLRRATHDNTIDTSYQVFAEIVAVDNVWTKI